MENRIRWIIPVVAIAVLTLAATPSWAGSKQQHRWEGVAIGIGAAILGSALIHHHGIHVNAPATVVHYSGYRRGPHHRFGHRGHGHQRHWKHRPQHGHRWHGRPHAGPHHRGGYTHRPGPRHPDRHFQPRDNHHRRDYRVEPRHNGSRKGNRY